MDGHSLTNNRGMMMEKVTDLISLEGLKNTSHTLLSALIDSEVSSNEETPILDALHVASDVHSFVDSVVYSGTVSILSNKATIELRLNGDVLAEW